MTEDEIYQEILNTLPEDKRPQFEDFVQGILSNMYSLAEYAEIDIDKWGNLLC